MTSLRIFTVDSYLTSPVQGWDPMYSQFRGSTVEQVPILRIFGSKGCIHIHGVFPYIYIPAPSEENNIDGLMHTIAENLDNAINSASNSKYHKKRVFKISQVNGIPFYGYHPEKKSFLKIFFYRPADIKIAVNQLESGSICGRIFQPHESHIPYHLQFFIDYNLYGMSFIYVSKFSDRVVMSEQQELENLYMLHPALAKVTHCEIEIDVLSEDILNNKNSSGDLSLNPGLAIIWEEEKERRRQGQECSEISMNDHENSGVISYGKMELELKAELKLALQHRNKAKSCNYASSSSSSSLVLDASMTEFHSQEIQFESQIDPGVKSVLENYIQMQYEEDKFFKSFKPEEDSILAPTGFQVDSFDDEEADLTQPLHEESECIDDTVVDITKMVTELEAPRQEEVVSQETALEGHSKKEEKITPKKEKKKKLKPHLTPERYTPLKVQIVKSPFKKTPDSEYFFSGSLLEKTCSQSSLRDQLLQSRQRTFSQKPDNLGQKVKKSLNFGPQLSQGLNDNISSPYSLETDLFDENLPSQNYSSIDSFYTAAFDETISQLNKKFSPLLEPPSRNDVLKNYESFNLKKFKKKNPFYSDSSDGKFPESKFKFQSSFSSIVEIQTKLHDIIFQSEAKAEDILKSLAGQRNVLITPNFLPPSYTEATNWLASNSNTKEIISEETLIQQPASVESCASDQTFILEMDETLETSKHKYWTMLILETLILTRGNLLPNPEYDSVQAVIYKVVTDAPKNFHKKTEITGIILSAKETITGFDEIKFVKHEKELFEELIKVVRLHDPDILAGYEVEMLSWGFLIHRGYVIGINFLSELSRAQKFNCSFLEIEQMKITDFDVKIPGRVVLNIWRMMRHEIAVMSYTFESMMFHILNTRVPHYSFNTLSMWWSHLSGKYRNLAILYYLTRVEGIAKLLDSLDLIGRTSELATLFGIQFFEVLSRGSQFRVESMMLRTAKPQNYVPVSPNMKQRADMKAPGCLPLIMEPESRLYTDPVIVLDFQSLYPSMMIAYNYCFSTCLGRVDELIIKEEITFGCTNLKVDTDTLLKIFDNIHISPAGIAFVNNSIRKGVLPQMLEQILETRLMVKRSMGRHKDDKILHRILHSRQLGLKLIANVTYGYTSANFSGRMPCIEVGDSVVSKGRETLEKAIKLVKETKRWGAKVIYGDTDSLFVLCPDKTKQEAFVIGQEIADAVTLSNPKPVKLKLEKIYQPCILQTKKRYVGFMYETPDQEKPEFDAKGIETVRRDGCVAVSMILEKSLRILFETLDLSKVKSYLCTQLTKIIMNEMSMQYLTFAREYRGMHGYQAGAQVPALKLAKEWTAKDPRAEPRKGERVGYVIVCGPPGFPLYRLVRAPHEVLDNKSLKLNAEYYITKAILPPLQRCLGLIGVDTFIWYKNLPKISKSEKLINLNDNKKATISQYFATINCIICDNLTITCICMKCYENHQLVATVLCNKILKLERRDHVLNQICINCCGRNYELNCNSLDCPIYYEWNSSKKSVLQLPNLRDLLLETCGTNSK